MNYFPMVSEACNRENVPYLSWIYDNPYQKGYSVNIINPCNYIFTFDSAMYEELSSQGVSTIYYAPLTANPDHLCPGTLTQPNYKHDISFVGVLYNEDHNFYEEFVKNATQHHDSYWIGYIDALIQAQLAIYGTDIITTAIPAELPALNYASINPWDEINAFFTTPQTILFKACFIFYDYRRYSHFSRTPHSVYKMLCQTASISIKNNRLCRNFRHIINCTKTRGHID